MIRKLLFRNGIRVATTAFAGLLLILMMSGCGDDKSTNPPAPALTMSVGCNNGLIDLVVRNAGGAMNQASRFVVSCDDGYCDTLMLSVGANDSMSCQLCNVHGDVTVTNVEWGLEAVGAACLSELFQDLVASVNLQSFVPSPLDEVMISVCPYKVYMQNLTSNQRTTELIPTESGLTVKFVLSNVTGDLWVTDNGPCPDITGDITISSIVVTTEVDFGEGDVTFGETEAAINNLVVNVDGIFGWIVEIVVRGMQDDFTPEIEGGIAAQINALAPDPNDFVTVNTACVE